MNEPRKTYVEALRSEDELLSIGGSWNLVRARARRAQLRLEERTHFLEAALTTLMADLDPDREAAKEMRRS